MPITRRIFLLGGAGLALSACVQDGTEGIVAEPIGFGPSAVASSYAALPDERFPIPAVDLKKLKPKYRRRLVDFPTAEISGTIIVDTPSRYLYLVMENGRAMRYGVGIGRDGFTWGGRGRIQYKRAWPRWTPPAEMVSRQPDVRAFSAENGGMNPGLGNPLGARALYIFKDGQDTLYRIHGTPDWQSVGKATSSGCVRMLNQDVVDLYDRVPAKAEIVVM